MPDIAEAFPLQVFADAVGLAEPGGEQLLAYGDMAFNAFGPRNERTRASLGQAAEESELPSPLLLIPVVAAYILCVGPLNRRFVQRLRAPVVLVATTPLVACAFAVLIFFAGYARRGSMCSQ